MRENLKDSNETEMKAMPLMEHLTELRKRIIWAFLSVCVFLCISLFFTKELLELLKQPLYKAIPGQHLNLHFTGPMEVFMGGLKVSFIASVLGSSPFWLYHFWKFLEPALYEKERKKVLPFTVMSVLLFFLGVLFCFYLILPMTLEFLITLGMESGVPMITVNDYLSLVILMILGFGVVFETPLILILCASLGLVTAKSLAHYRRHMVVGSLVIGALLTPPDPLSQVLMAVPLYMMYEISIWVIRFMFKDSEKRA